MSSKPPINSPMSGRQFQELLRAEFEQRNTGLNSLTYAQLGELCGLSGRYISHLITDPEPNPSTKVMRCILLTLGYEVENPEQDVIPHLKSKGVFDPSVHGRKGGSSS